MAITCSDFHAIGIRLDLLDVETVLAAGVTLSPREIVAFRGDPLRFFMESCGPTRRQEIFAFVEQPRSRSVYCDPVIAARCRDVADRLATLPMAEVAGILKLTA